MATQVKICGIRTSEALEAAVDAGADYVGLVHYPPSPRHLELELAADLARRVRADGRARSVMLVVDAADALIDQVAATVGPDMVQLHGSESPERVRAVRARLGRPIIKAVSVATGADARAAALYLEPLHAADVILFDAKPPPDPNWLPGGNGLTFDWRILAEVRHPFALAGGLTPENVADAIRLAGPAIVDVSSGVECAPGVKDPALIRRFLRAAKAANTVEEET